MPLPFILFIQVRFLVFLVFAQFNKIFLRGRVEATAQIFMTAINGRNAEKGVQTMAVFRIQRTDDYTVMSNYHLRDQNLSLKAKGLLSMMLSHPDELN